MYEIKNITITSEILRLIADIDGRRNNRIFNELDGAVGNVKEGQVIENRLGEILSVGRNWVGKSKVAGLSALWFWFPKVAGLFRVGESLAARF